MDLDIRYARNGDINIAYAVLGKGPRDLVFVQGTFTNLLVDWEGDRRYRRFCEKLAEFRRVILFDTRGMGLSDRVESGTYEDRMDDVGAVMDAVGSERAVIMGVSEGGLMACLFAASYPARTEALILLGAEVKEENSEDWKWGDGTREEVEESLRTLPERWGRPSPRLIQWFVPSLAGEPGLEEFFARAQLQSASPRAITAFLRASFAVDNRPILSAISAPTLVAHRADDVGVNVHQGRYLGEHIPGARYVEVPGRDHAPWVGGKEGDGDDMLDEIRGFLTGVRSAPEPERQLSTVLFTDIVGSTRLAAELGDRRWSGLLADHHRIVRDRLADFRGRVIETAGDGVFALVDGPARAVRGASAVIEAVRPLGLEIRAGVHTGEVELAGDKVTGLAVHIGARVAAQAGPGEVLVSGTVHDLVVGSGIAFTDRGSRELAGVPGTWRLYAVV
ncbi:MAG: adenylate/guanylate cyclase domain-containing protein [Candidatus Limnocylindrales bacterium]